MDALLKKLNVKDQRVIHVVNPPDTLGGVLDAWRAEVEVVVDGLDGVRDVTFAIGFAITQDEVDRYAAQVADAAAPDALVWAAYPKGTSKRYRCEFNRDTGWAAFGERGLEPVRQVAVDEDWSAIRFRPIERIAKLTRATAITDEGRRRIAEREQAAREQAAHELSAREHSGSAS